MKRVFFLRLISLAAIAVLISGLITGYLLNRQSQENIDNNITSVLNVAAANNEYHTDKHEMAQELSKMCSGYRITVIDSDGNVLGDSQITNTPMENHLDRPEVSGALKKGYAVSKRYSETTQRNYLYVAVRTEDDMVIRAAAPLEKISENFLSLLPAMILSIIISLMVALVAAGRWARDSLAPIERIVTDISLIDTNTQYKLSETNYDELNPLVKSFNSLTDKIASNLSVLESEKQKLEFLLDSMQQGLVVIDENLKVIHYNKAAVSLLDAANVSIGQSLYTLTRNQAITSAAENCLLKHSAVIFDMVTGEKSVHQIAVSYLSSKWIPSGVMLIVTDITQQYRLQQMRKEFVANASHELKTPITSIKGFAELLAAGLVNDKAQQQDYLNRILKESEHMTTLIGDILKLSALDEGKATEPKISINLMQEAEEVCSAISPQADDKNVTLRVQGSPVAIQARKEDMRQLIANLIENAVKYNKEKGNVTVTVSQVGCSARLVISDNGIGIPAEDISRIFERFYRVDKGRSRAVGGTGLGLAIVKHIVSSYSGEISVKSQPEKGTEITVTLPLNI